MGNITKRNIKNSQAFLAWFFIIVILLAFSLVFLILNKAYSEIKPELQTGLEGAMPSGSPVNVTTTLNQTGDASLMFDKLMPFLLIGLFGFVLILAGGIMRHPIMIFVGIIILGVVMTLAVIYSNLYNEISSTDEFASTKAQMPVQDLFMHYLPIIVAVMAVGITGAILWSRSSTGGGL